MPSDHSFRIVETEGLTSESLAWLRVRAEVLSVPHEDSARLEAALLDAHGLIVRTYTRVDDELLEHAPLLRVVGRAGVGLDNIDLAACRARGIDVVHTPDANTGAVSELLFALLLEVLRPKIRVTDAVDQATWKAWRQQLVGERELSELTLGILGFGRIGRRVARAAQGLGMNTLYHDLQEIPEDERGAAVPVSAKRLFQTADILTVHVDGRAENRHLINAEVMSQRPRGSILANLSRGLVVDAMAVAKALDDDPASSAIMDVHDNEPLPANHPLLHRENVYLTPHLGAGTRSAKNRMSWVVEDVWRVLQNEPPQNPAP